MTFKSILFGNHQIDLKSTPPAFWQDLQLDYLIDIIGGTVKGYDIRPYYYTMPDSPDIIAYRQEIYKDLEDTKLYSSINSFCHSVSKSILSHKLSKESEGVIQAATFQLEAADEYWQGLTQLDDAFRTYTPASQGLQLLHTHITEHMQSLVALHFPEAISRAKDFFSKISFQLTIDEDRIAIESSERASENILRDLAQLLPTDIDSDDVLMNEIYPGALEPSYLEATLINLLRKSDPEIFRELEAFHKAFPNFYSTELLNFADEIQFYISYIEFIVKTKALGHDFAMPCISTDGTFAGTGVYDMALVWRNAHHNYTVVDNDFTWTKTPSFFVVTGPNQGGKTTFARSMGQAVYFSMMGLPAAASSITIPYFRGIGTHFEAEEVLQSNSGKLKDEINRLKPMMHQDNHSQFIILNELFTTATTHDAMIMGKKVMEHFLAKQCYGIYVTHIQELAEESDTIISLVAEAENNEEHVRTYRIIPMAAQGYGFSESLVNQFSLNYEDIIRRLS